MHFAIAALWAFLVMLAVTQKVGDLPKCAQTCVGSSLGGCDAINITCICTNKAFISETSCCIAGACDPNDQAETIKFADQLCAVVMVSLPQSVGCLTTGQNSSSIVDATTSTGDETSTGTTILSTASVSTSMSSNGATSTAEKTNSLFNTPTFTSASTSQSSAAAVHTRLDPGIGIAGLAVAALPML